MLSEKWPNSRYRLEACKSLSADKNRYLSNRLLQRMVLGRIMCYGYQITVRCFLAAPRTAESGTAPSKVANRPPCFTARARR